MSGRRPGKQPGDPSTTLRQVLEPDERIEVPVESCACGADLSGVAVAATVRRQVFECAPPPPPTVTEYLVAVKLCPCCGRRATGLVPAQAGGRVQFGALVKARSVALNLWHHVPFRRTAQLLEQLCAVKVSVGALVRYRREAAARLGPFLERTRVLLGFEPVLGVDETPAKVGAALAYVHVARCEQYTVMHVGGRTKADIDAGAVLPGYHGVIMRDGYAGYAHFTDARHAWCGAHTLRDIKLVHDADPERQTGLAAMRDSLLLMLQTTKETRAAGRDALDAKNLSFHRACYAGAVNQIRIDNQGRSDPVAHAARTLATRFETQREMILRFLTDLAVPFTNNGSEQEIRPVKIHQRSQGGAWKTLQGLADFATIWSYLITAAKHGIDQIPALTMLFNGNPWLPPLSELC